MAAHGNTESLPSHLFDPKPFKAKRMKEKRVTVILFALTGLGEQVTRD